MVPFQPNDKFVGRGDILENIVQKLAESDNYHCLALVGLGGVGLVSY